MQRACDCLTRGSVYEPVHVWQREEETATWQTERDVRCCVTGLKRLKASRLRSRLPRLRESPSPAVLLVDDHVHFPGSVFGNPPVRHQQTDTCGEGGMRELINTHASHKQHTHTCWAVRPLYWRWQPARGRPQKKVTKASPEGLVNQCCQQSLCQRHTRRLSFSWTQTHTQYRTIW